MRLAGGPDARPTRLPSTPDPRRRRAQRSQPHTHTDRDADHHDHTEDELIYLGLDRNQNG